MKKKFVLSTVLVLLSCGCTVAEVTVKNHVTPVSISDEFGRSYDVTYAITYLYFDTDNFSAGKGPDSRPPLIAPAFLSPGDIGYPGSGEDAHVLGTAVSSDARAYNISEISRNEVVDDVVGGTHIAVAY